MLSSTTLSQSHLLWFVHPQVMTSSGRRVFAAGLLTCLYKLVLQVAEHLRGNPAFPELFGPMQGVLSEVMCAPFCSNRSSLRTGRYLILKRDTINSTVIPQRPLALSRVAGSFGGLCMTNLRAAVCCLQRFKCRLRLHYRWHSNNSMWTYRGSSPRPQRW